jgi:hypothetical protein
MDEEPKIPFLGRHGSHSPKDSFFENLLSHLSHSSFEDVFSSIPPKDFLDSLSLSFEDFLKGCHWNFKTGKKNPELTLNYFRYILQRFQLQKGSAFSESEGQLIHIILSEPISIEGEGAYKIASLQYEYLNKAISVLGDYVKQLTPKNEPIKESFIESNHKRTRLHGFKIKNKDCLNTAFERLKSLKLIDKGVSIKDFENAFSNWIPENKITWLKGPGLLSYFIKKINGKGIEDEKKNIWMTTINCFQDKNQKDFIARQLRFAKKPTKTEDIDLVIKAINRYFGE